MAITIDSDFEGGNIEVLDVEGASARLAIRADAGGRWRQWFFFRVRGAAGGTLALHICNAGEAALPAPGPTGLDPRRGRRTGEAAAGDRAAAAVGSGGVLR